MNHFITIFSLDIYHNCRNSTVMKGNSRLKFRFSSLVIVLGSLAVLSLGAGPFRHREFLKFLSSAWSPKMVFLSIIISRIILISLTFLVILGCGLLVLMVENIPLSGGDFNNILWYLMVTYLSLIFLFIIGTILGSLQNKIGLFSSILVVWFLLVFIWPGVVDSIIEDKADKITSSYKTDTQKLPTVNEFENIYKEERGGYKNYTLEEARKIVGGYGNYLNFSKYLREQRRKFLLFWIDRVYYNDPKVMKNFVTGDENIFRGRGMKPTNFWTGCRNTMGLIILLGLISYVVFKGSLVFMKTRDIKKLGKVNLKKGFKGEVFLGDIDITRKKSQSEFIYICHPDSLPGDIKVKYLLKFYGCWTRQSPGEINKVLTNNKIKAILAQQGATVVYLTTTQMIGVKTLKMGSYFEDGEAWVYLVKSHKQSLMVPGISN